MVTCHGDGDHAVEIIAAVHEDVFIESPLDLRKLTDIAALVATCK